MGNFLKKCLFLFKTKEDKPQLTDTHEIDRLYKKNRLSIMLAITLGYGAAYTCRLGLNIIKSPLIDKGIFSAEELGKIGSAMMYGYAFGKFFNGFLADHANIRVFFSFGLLMSALLNIIMGLSVIESSAVFLFWTVIWGLNGYFQGFGAPSSSVVLSQWFGRRERGTFYGIWSASHSIGEGLTYWIGSVIVVYLGWRFGFIMPGLLIVLTSAAVYFALEDRPPTIGLPPVSEWQKKNETSALIAENVCEKELSGVPAYELDKKSRISLQLSLLKMPSLWIIGTASAMMYISRYAINSWGILYLEKAKHYDTIQAGALIGINNIAGIIGSIAYGFISDRFFKSKRPPVTLIFGIIEILSLIIIFFSPPGQTFLLGFGFLLYGMTLAGVIAVLGGLFAIDIAPKRTAGAAMGFVGILSYIGAGVQELVSGNLIENGMTMEKGVIQYNFDSAIVFWIGASVISCILAATQWRVKVHD
jgi:OPA family sugar phosphate sensor protein UhpC-like MFS transporter